MSYEQYDPEKHDLITAGRKGGKWRDRFEAAAVSPIVVRPASEKRSVYVIAKGQGYKVKVRVLADGSGFVLWAEKLPGGNRP